MCFLSFDENNCYKGEICDEFLCCNNMLFCFSAALLIFARLCYCLFAFASTRPVCVLWKPLLLHRCGTWGRTSWFTICKATGTRWPAWAWAPRDRTFSQTPWTTQVRFPGVFTDFERVCPQRSVSNPCFCVQCVFGMFGRLRRRRDAWRFSRATFITLKRY